MTWMLKGTHLHDLHADSRCIGVVDSPQHQPWMDADQVNVILLGQLPGKHLSKNLLNYAVLTQKHTCDVAACSTRIRCACCEAIGFLLRSSAQMHPTTMQPRTFGCFNEQQTQRHHGMSAYLDHPKTQLTLHLRSCHD